MENKKQDTASALKDIISHAKEYGFVFPSSEIYDGLQAVYDYGQNGVELKNNLKTVWYKAMTMLNDNVVGLDAAIFMHPLTWKASGHVDSFNDPMIDNKDSKKRYRADVLIEDYCAKIENKIEKEINKAQKRFGKNFDKEQFIKTSPRPHHGNYFTGKYFIMPAIPFSGFHEYYAIDARTLEIFNFKNLWDGVFIILCGLFASLMSTVDSTFNSLATLWSTDIYATYINKKATDREKINAGRKTILFSLGTALIMGFILLYLKFDNPNSAFTHTLNNLRYYINCGIVVLICASVLLIKPNKKVVFIAFIASLPINIALQFLFPEMNYFLRAFWVIFSSLLIALLGNKGGVHKLTSLFQPSSRRIKNWGWALAISLLLLHIIFH